MEELTLATVIFVLLVLRAVTIVRLRKRVAAPPAHPAARRREALNRAALDADWNWPR